MDLEAVFCAEPGITIDDCAAAFDEVGVQFRVRMFLEDESEDFVAFGEATDDFLVSDVIEE